MTDGCRTRRVRGGAPRLPGPASALLLHALLLLGAAVAGAGCASGSGGATGSAFREHLAAGREEAAAEAFEADSALHDDAEALFRAGLLYADPDAPVYRPGRAGELLRRLLERHPDSGHGPAARALLGLLGRADSLSRQIERLKAVDLGRPAADSTPPR